MARLPNDRSKDKKQNKPRKRRIDPKILKIEKAAEKEIEEFNASNIPANKENSIIFEQIRKNYTNRSVVKNIDTAFSYYKFPPTTKLNVADFSIPDQNIDILEDVQKSLVKDAPDNISGYHKIPNSIFPLLGVNKYKKTSVGYDAAWNIYEKNGSGYGEQRRKAPFFQTISGQPLIDGKFYLTPDVIKTCQDQGKVIKFKVQFAFQMALVTEATMRARYKLGKSEVAYNPAPVDGVTYPYQYNTAFQMRLLRTSAVSGWHHDYPEGNDGRLIYRASQGVVAQMDYNSFRKYRGPEWSRSNPTNSQHLVRCNLQYILDPRIMKEYDYWEVSCGGGNPGYYITDGSYWEVELIDDPGKGVASYNKRSKYYGKQVILPKKKMGGYDVLNENLFPAIGPGSINKAELARNAAAAAKAAKEKKEREEAAIKAWQKNVADRIAKTIADLKAKINKNVVGVTLTTGKGIVLDKKIDLQSFGQSFNFFKKSDIRLKKNINLIGTSPSGLNIYSFEYKNPSDGEGLFQGVISKEVPEKAIIVDSNGYDMVNYDMIDVEFKQI